MSTPTAEEVELATIDLDQGLARDEEDRLVALVAARADAALADTEARRFVQGAAA